MIMLTIGSVLFGALILFSGIGHFSNYKKSLAFTKSFKVPMPGVAVVGTGLLLILGGLSFVFQTMMYEGAILLIIFFVPVTFIMHAFWKQQDTQKKMIEMHYFMGNMMVVGLLLMTLSWVG